MSETKNKAKRNYNKKRISTLTLVLLITLLLAVSGTAAYILTTAGPLVNIFKPSKVSCEVEEVFNGTVKSNVTVKNIGDIDAYLRVKLVTYRVNDDGDRIGGGAVIPDFTLGTGWFENDGFYYYKSQVEPGETPSYPLIGATGITLISYTDADGGKQVIEVLAEAIQSVPEGAVTEAWGMTVVNGELTSPAGP